MKIHASRLRELITQSNLIEEVSSERELEQSLFAWTDILHSLTGPLTHEVICSLQRIITQNQTNLTPTQRGRYRDAERPNSVFVGGRPVTPYYMVQGVMDNWLLDYAEPGLEFDPLEAHIRFEICHPFYDGNGRTGRMLLWWHQFQKGQQPTLFLAKDKETEYYPLFNRSKTR